MYKYAQLKRFNRDRRLQVYLYAFIYVDTQTILVGNHFPANTFFVKYNEMLTIGPVPKHWIGFSYIRS